MKRELTFQRWGRAGKHELAPIQSGIGGKDVSHSTIGEKRVS